VALVAGLWLLGLASVGRMPAHDTTDARYLEVAREMQASGNWLVPQLAGVPHLEKPPLAYWAAALGFSALGTTPFAGRLLEQLAVVGTALLLLAWARARIGAETGRTAGGLLLTSGLVFVSSRALHTDLFQLFLLTAALLALYEGSQARRGATAAGFALLGASMLAKGPIALLVAIGVVAPFLALRRGERALPAREAWLGAALFAAIGIPWFAYLAARDPGLLGWFFEHQVVSRVSGGAEGHRHGGLYLPAHLLAGALPWAPVALLALWRLRPRPGLRMPAPDLYLMLWALVPCLVFELFATKLATYLLPSFPALALLIALAEARGRLDDPLGRGAIALSVALAGFSALAVAGLLGVQAAGLDAAHWLEPGELEAPAGFAIALAGIGAFTLALASAAARRPPSWSLPRGVLAAGLVFAAGGAALAPGLPDHERDGEIVRSVPGARLIEYGTFEPGLLFYFGDTERFYVAVERRRAAEARHDPRASHLGLRRQDVAAMLRDEQPTFLLAKRAHADALAAELGLLPVRRSRRFALLANPEAAKRLAASRSEELASGSLHTGARDSSL
jgi:4-amino-4-deoxy-L-arabinose transferase-like glycosyltransferase